MAEQKSNVGKIVQVIGPVIDAEFDPESMPEIYNALELNWDRDGVAERLVFEVAQHIGRNQV
ncbi:MAG: F0F1 ATP synthase subunit beta, partial [marine benthic group bacterium]|nr:F0F1 ATP synthase subunit beta [Gemmatimonadota bacterium]